MTAAIDAFEMNAPQVRPRSTAVWRGRPKVKFRGFFCFVVFNFHFIAPVFRFQSISEVIADAERSDEYISTAPIFKFRGWYYRGGFRRVRALGKPFLKFSRSFLRNDGKSFRKRRKNGFRRFRFC